MQHSDYISGYMAMGEVLKTMCIHPQSFTISKQEFFDQPLTQLTSGGVKYTRAPLAARGSATCSMVQTCQVNWTIKIPANTLAIQLNRVILPVPPAVIDAAPAANIAVNFTGKADATTAQTVNMAQTNQLYAPNEVLRFWLGFSTACGPFNQFAICKYSTKLWDTSIYAREQAVICSNSLSDLCTNNSVSVSPLESIIQGKRHCGVFIDVPLSAIDAAVTAGTTFHYKIPNDIVFSGVLDLNQLNPIFNSFPVLTRNYASLYLQLWMQDFLQDLKVAMFMTFAMPQYPTWFFPVLFHNFDLIIDQRHVIPAPYEALTQAVNGQMFDCFVDQDVVSAPSDLAYPDTVEVGLTPNTHYLCDAIVRIMFNDNPDPQVLSLEVIGEMGGSMVRNG
ncbi:MAG: hypothetical protein EZS28_007346 [Streblomastix strix]|uniref:Uncharacterized protein n=1 Tax=Streblomastix strix TaxID=222440 RepID=A0A5J4WRE4_9EUKA|nr:MAG: hypothetical protein EZS28_007346 [Streblomastix strix]